MDSAFIYDSYVTGKDFVGRSSDVTILSNLLLQGENVVIYEPPKSGKTSLVQQALHSLKTGGNRFRCCELSLMSVRGVADFALKAGDAVLRCCAATPDEYESIAGRYLGGTHYVFDREVYASSGRILSLNWDVDEADVRAVFVMAEELSSSTGERLVFVIDEFQNVMKTGGGESLCSILAGVMREYAGRSLCPFVLIGSCVNAMDDIFRRHGRFQRLVSRVPLSGIDAKEEADYAVKGFLSSGKVCDRDTLLGAAALFRGNMWYFNHLCAVADSLSRGYIMEPLLLSALKTLISVHEPRFRAVMDDLTTFQICFLKAVLDGHTKFSSSEVISRYNLSSSANVRRLKDALCKKEILFFDDNDAPHVLDPLFEYWVRQFYFEK